MINIIKKSRRLKYLVSVDVYDKREKKVEYNYLIELAFIDGSTISRTYKNKFSAFIAEFFFKYLSIGWIKG